jgi:hypothetical protein
VAPTAPKKSPVVNGRVDLDLDELDIQPDAPLIFKKSGKKIRLLNLRDFDWQTVAALQESSVHDLFTTVVHPDDYETFLALKITDKELTAVAQLYRQQFRSELGDSGESDA